MIIRHLRPYAHLTRLHKPIGLCLLLWPTLWALWLASADANINHRPAWPLVFIFVLGVVLMRSAGCVINDYADRHIDPLVARTRDRPLACGKIKPNSALILFVLLSLAAFLLVLQLNRLTVYCAFVGAALTLIYPFLKRITQLPQLALGLAFTWGIPMAFAAEQNQIPRAAWILFFTATLWPIIYDTFYALSDREEDLKIGVKSTAILFGRATAPILAALQLGFLCGMFWVGHIFSLTTAYYVSLILVALLFCYQQRLSANKQNQQAFLNNNWVGLLIFIGILSGL